MIKRMSLVPEWLESLLSLAFFVVCSSHKHAPTRTESNMFCLDCKTHPFCFYCRSTLHKGHRVIQVRRSSYHDVVRVQEIEDLVDISEVQTYSINGARVLFLNERPQLKGIARCISKGGSHFCESCGRGLLDSFRFCCIRCKLIGVRKNGNASFILSAKKTGEVTAGKRKAMAINVEEGKEEGELCEGLQKETSKQSTSTLRPLKSRRKKGMPTRAHLGFSLFI